MITPRERKLKDGNSSWVVEYRNGGRHGSRVTRTFGRYEDAHAYARNVDRFGAEHAEQILMNEIGDQGSGQMSLKDWCETHIKENLSGLVQDDTVKRYFTYVNNDLGFLGEMPIKAITAKDVGKWIKVLSATPSANGSNPSSKTLKNKHGFVSSAFNAAVTERHITFNPCRGTNIPRTPVQPMTFLTHEEYERFIDCFIPHYRPLVAFLFGTGLRWSEASALRVADVDPVGMTVTVWQAWKQDGTLGAPKTDKSKRTVTIAPEVMVGLDLNRDGNALLFTTITGKRIKNGHFHTNEWQPALRLANNEPPKRKTITKSRQNLKPLEPPLGKHPRIHDARHTCASWLLGAGVPINYVMNHLGHENITTTVNRYGHIMPAARAAVSNAISMAMSPAHPMVEAA